MTAFSSNRRAVLKGMAAMGGLASTCSLIGVSRSFGQSLSKVTMQLGWLASNGSSDYTKKGFQQARIATANIMRYLVGCGSMPSIGTENPSLTMLAITNCKANRIISLL